MANRICTLRTAVIKMKHRGKDVARMFRLIPALPGLRPWSWLFLKYLRANRCVDTLPLHCLAAGGGGGGGGG